MRTQRKTPMRKCTGCQEMKNKKEMIRIVRDPEGKVFIDRTGKKSGRGAYLCKSMECFAAAQKGHRLERSFGCRVSEEIYEEMKHALQTELAGTADHLS